MNRHLIYCSACNTNEHYFVDVFKPLEKECLSKLKTYFIQSLFDFAKSKSTHYKNSWRT